MSDAGILSVVVPLLVAAIVAWLAIQRLQVRQQKRQELKDLDGAEEWDADRALECDQERQAELRAWLQRGALPSPLSRVYPAHQEFAWEWGRLQGHGYRLDHDPVVLDDGQLMVTYSRGQAVPTLRIAR